MSELERKVASALRNKAGLGGLFNPMQEETDAVMAVIREELGKLHMPLSTDWGWETVCSECGEDYPCPTMQMVEES